MTLILFVNRVICGVGGFMIKFLDVFVKIVCVITVITAFVFIFVVFKVIKCVQFKVDAFGQVQGVAFHEIFVFLPIHEAFIDFIVF